MLFQFISTNLKEINDMVNIDSIENPQANYKEKKKFREKDEDSNKDLSGLNKIDEVNSNKVSSMSSFKMQKSIRNSNNSSNIIKNSNSNSHHNENINILENKNLLKEKMLSIHSKVSNNVSSVNSENIKQIFEESLMGKSYLSDELNSFKNNDKRRNNEVYTNFNNKIKGKKSKLLNNLKFKNDSNSIIHKDKTFKNDSNDLDKTKEYLPFNENNFSLRINKRDLPSIIKNSTKGYNTVAPIKMQLLKKLNTSLNANIELSKTPEMKKEGKCLLV